MSYVIALAETGSADISNVGGKAIGIGRLMSAGARVPAGFCIQSAALADLLAAGGAAAGDITAACMNAPFPDGLDDEIALALGNLMSQPDHSDSVMVRSSASAEDTLSSRAPGVYTSLRVPADIASVLAATRMVWASSADDGSRSYQARVSPSPDLLPMAVIVQQFVPAQLGGAVSTIDPATGDPKRIMISWVHGHPAELLSSLDPGSTVLLDKAHAKDDQTALPQLIQTLPAEVSRLEKLFDEALDIEFIVDPDGITHLVQCRPMPYRPGWRSADVLTADPTTDVSLHSPKIDAVRLNNYTTADPFKRIIIWPSVFDGYRASGSLSAEVGDYLSEALRPLVDTGAVALRPAYWSALNSSDNMPQSGRLRSVAECLNHLETLFRYIIDNHLDDYTAEVAVLAGNWLPVVASAVAASDPANNRVRIDAAPGYPEALETTGFESCVVDLDSREVTVVGAGASDLAALSGDEYREAAAMSQALSHRLGSAIRVEILVVERDGGRNMVIWQVDRLGARPGVATFALTEAEPADAVQSTPVGRAVKIGSAADMLAAAPDANADAIFLLDLSALPPRDREAQILIAQQAARLGRPVVLRGSPLSHLTALLREYGVAVYPVREIAGDIPADAIVAVVPEVTA